MPGPTTKNNPWADELKKSRRKSSTKGISGKEGNKEIRRRTNGDDSAISDGGGDADVDKTAPSSAINKSDILCGGGGNATTLLNLGETKEMATKPQLSKQHCGPEETRQ